MNPHQVSNELANGENTGNAVSSLKKLNLPKNPIIIATKPPTTRATNIPPAPSSEN